MEHTLAQLSNKQNLLEIKIKNLNDINKLLLEMIVDARYINTDTMTAIQDICKEIKKCAASIQEASDEIGEYAAHASLQLKEFIKANEAKTLKSTLDSWDTTKVANAAAEAGSIMPVVDNAEDIDPYTASVGEVKENG